MAADPEPRIVPEDVKDAACVARRLGDKNPRTRDEEEILNQARLKVAFWALREEGVHPSWDNLAYVLGEHAEAIRPAYDRVLADRDEVRTERRRPGRRSAGDGVFWRGANLSTPPTPPPTRKPGPAGKSRP